jgi:hypothetical protein
MEYIAKINEINKNTEELMQKYDSNLFVVNDDFNLREELEILCGTLLSSINASYISFSSDHSDQLKKKIEETITWMEEERSDEQLKSKIFEINEMCNIIYHQTSRYEDTQISDDEEDEEEDIIFDPPPSTNRIKENIDDLIDQLDNEEENEVKLTLDFSQF